ncbi:MAG TPA: CoA pyrophosphatase [Kouleothrix sp.]|uniref:NUDIX hydrolase n=1 Tax=Kouleothrix sp. TaxID=2779161 RepID=UPI002B896F1C|nr:CoA pyrophosphatase [Kouleothrix sp.]HRC76603.1 CoA pyrophosphatase [Kouleothrix sp.]
MPANGTAWFEWAPLIEAALRPGAPVPHEDLLLVRDSAGQLVRRFDPPPGLQPRLGAVLLLLYPDGADLRLPLTVRSDRLPSHRGEVSLPGGAIDPGDAGPEDAALRECYEELGVDPRAVRVWGTLSSFYIQPSNFQITPVVGFAEQPPVLRPNDQEVSSVLSVTVRELLDPALVVTEQWNLRGLDVMVPFFAIEGYKVWGATAVVLSEFVARIRRALAARGGAHPSG